MHYMCLLVPIAAQEVSTICLRLTHTPLQVFKSASTFKVKKAKYYELAYDGNTIIIFNFFQHLIKVCHVLYSFHSRIFRMIMTSVVRDVHGNTVSNSWLPEWSCMNSLRWKTVKKTKIEQFCKQDLCSYDFIITLCQREHLTKHMFAWSILPISTFFWGCSTSWSAVLI